MRRATIFACVTALGLAAVAAGPTVSAANGASVSPSSGPSANGTSTRMTISGSGFSASSTVEFTKCSVAAGQKPGAVVSATASTLIVMVPSSSPSTCTVTVKTAGSSVDAGTYTWSTDDPPVYVTQTGIVPSLLPLSGDATFLVTGSITTKKGPSEGDVDGFTGATGASLTCGSTTVAASIVSVLNKYQVIVKPAVFTGVSAGTPCAVTVTLKSGNTTDSGSLTPAGVWVDTNVPAVSVSPSSGPAGQDPAVTKPQVVTVSGPGLQDATAVSFDYCPKENPAGTYAADIVSRTQTGQLSVRVPNVPPGTCAVAAVLPAAGTRPKDYTVASIPSGTASAGGFEFKVPFQGPIEFTLANPYDNGVPRSGITDEDLWVSLIGSPVNPNAAPAWPGVNIAEVTSIPFTTKNADFSYDAATHSATFTISAELDSGLMYFSDRNISGHAPDALASKARFGMFELTYDGGGVHSDLTLIDQVGMTMSSVFYPDPAISTEPFVGSYRDTGCLVDIVNELSKVGVNMAATTQKPPGIMKYNGTVPPPDATSLPAPGQWTAADLSADKGWIGLVGASKLTTAYPSVADYTDSITGPLTVSDHLGNDPEFSGQFDYTATLAGGYWTLAGTMQDGKNPGPTLQLEQTGLSGASSKEAGGTGYGVYGQDGPFRLKLPGQTTWNPWNSDGDAHKGGAVDSKWSNLVKTIYRDFIAGFAYGYWGSGKVQGGGSTTGDNAVNFTQNPLDHAYVKAQPAYPNAKGQYAWNVYDDVIRSGSNVAGTGNPKPSGAYGMPYSDTFVPSALSPGMSQANIHKWTITLGDPKTGCKATSPELEPGVQQLEVPVGGSLQPVPNLKYRAANGIVAMVEYAALNFEGTVRYVLSGVDGKPAQLPSGLTFNKSTGVISGTPTASMAATLFIVTGSSGSESATARISLTVGKQSIMPVKQVIRGDLGQQITPTIAYTETNFSHDPVYSISPDLPDGLELDEKTGVISGIAKKVQPAASYLVTATDGDEMAQANVSIEVDANWSVVPALQVVTGTVGTAVAPSLAFGIDGFQYPPTFTVSPDLPDGLVIDPVTGVVSGTPRKSQPLMVFVVQADGEHGKAFATIAISVAGATLAVTPGSQKVTVKEGSYGSTAPLSASGFSGPVTYAISPTRLPDGMTFSSSTGVVSGWTKDLSDPRTYTVTARDGQSSAAATITLSVVPGANPTPTPTPTSSPTPTPSPSGCPVFTNPDGTCTDNPCPGGYIFDETLRACVPYIREGVKP